jgi:hypothetical protein
MTDRNDRVPTDGLDPALVFGKGVPFEEAGARRALCPTCEERTEQRGFRVSNDPRSGSVISKNPLTAQRRQRRGEGLDAVVWLCTTCGSDTRLTANTDPVEDAPATCQFCGQPLQDHSMYTTCSAWTRI